MGLKFQFSFHNEQKIFVYKNCQNFFELPSNLGSLFCQKKLNQQKISNSELI